MPEYDLMEAVALLQRLGYDGVEWRVQMVDPALQEEPPSFWRHNRATVDLRTIAEQAPAVAALTRGAGLEMPVLATYLRAFAGADVETVLAAARRLGVPAVRVGVPSYDRTRPYGELYAEAREALESVSRLAAAYGIKVLVEIHMGTIIPSASLAYRLLEGLDPQLVGAIYDPGNMVNEGFEAWRMGMQLLGPYLAHVHVKNYGWWPGDDDERGTRHWQARPAPLWQGMVDWGLVIDDLKAVGYDGWLSLEDFTTAPTEAKLAADIAYLRRLGA